MKLIYVIALLAAPVVVQAQPEECAGQSDGEYSARCLRASQTLAYNRGLRKACDEVGGMLKDGTCTLLALGNGFISGPLGNNGGGYGDGTQYNVPGLGNGQDQVPALLFVPNRQNMQQMQQLQDGTANQ